MHPREGGKYRAKTRKKKGGKESGEGEEIRNAFRESRRWVAPGDIKVQRQRMKRGLSLLCYHTGSKDENKKELR